MVHLSSRKKSDLKLNFKKKQSFISLWKYRLTNRIKYKYNFFKLLTDLNFIVVFKSFTELSGFTETFQSLLNDKIFSHWKMNTVCETAPE